jgi:hypothetical protein
MSNDSHVDISSDQPGGGIVGTAVRLAGFDRWPGRRSAHFALTFGLFSLLIVQASSVRSQNSQPQPSLGLQEQGSAPVSPSPVAPEPPAHEEKPGLFNEMGRLFDKVLPLKSPGQTIDDLNARAREGVKDAGDALSRITKPSNMVSGRAICTISANGTPDCKSGADKLCQGKGYKQGKSLNTDSAESCSAKVLIPGRARKPDDCRTNTYVTSALCE